MNRLVAIDLPGGAAFLGALARVWDAGDTALPVDQRLPFAAKQKLLTALRPAAVITADTAETMLSDAVPTLTGDAVVIATSGTTGDPKGVLLTHSALRSSALSTSERLGIEPANDRWYGCLPVAHIGGFSVVTKALLTGTPLTLVAGFDPVEVNAAAATHSRISLVATALSRVNTTGWRTVLLGGSAMPEKVPPCVVKTYGMTETGSGLVYDGIAVRDAEVRIVAGQIEVRGPMLLRAYRSDDPEGRSARSADGWFATGDGGRLDPDGRLRVRGRIGDVIVTGGEKVWPDSVERTLQSMPGVAEVAVAGRPDPEWGHIVVAWIVPTDPSEPPSLDSIRAQVKQSLPVYAAPKAVVVVDNLPRTALGKIQRGLLPFP